MLELIGVLMSGTAAIGGFAVARTFVRDRLRFVDAAHSGKAPWIAGTVALVAAVAAAGSCGEDIQLQVADSAHAGSPVGSGRALCRLRPDNQSSDDGHHPSLLMTACCRFRSTPFAPLPRCTGCHRLMQRSREP